MCLNGKKVTCCAQEFKNQIQINKHMEGFLLFLLFIVICAETGTISKTKFLAHTPSDVSDVPRADVAIHNVNPSAFYRGRSQELLAGVLGRMLLGLEYQISSVEHCYKARNYYK